MVELTDNTIIQKNGLQVMHYKHRLRSGASITLTQSYSNDKILFHNHFVHEQRQAAMHFIFNGQTTFTQSDFVPPAQFGGDKCNLMLIQPNDTKQIISAKGDFAMVSFYMDLNYFISLLNVAAEALPEKFKRAIYKNVCSCNNFRWSSKAYYAISQLLTTKPNEPLSHLIMESKMLELIAIMLETEQCNYYSNISLSKSDIEKVKYIQEFLLTDISVCYTHEQLARQAGTNEFILKKGFREVFGKPVYQYILQKRMEKAMNLLLTSHLPVSEIAMMVGYEDASGFTRAFKKVFNLVPVLVRRNSVFT